MIWASDVGNQVLELRHDLRGYTNQREEGGTFCYVHTTWDQVLEPRTQS